MLTLFYPAMLIFKYKTEQNRTKKVAGEVLTLFYPAMPIKKTGSKLSGGGSADALLPGYAIHLDKNKFQNYVAGQRKCYLHGCWGNHYS